ncbi:uncharacterized protein LOC126654936 isoform X1 [Mercurialis annua]|uniref:uncharacterized protein LOC126654936 isoform X1 n=1 Tax=Mercurialis annua TaxID=3986 RepID=UPI00216101E6|nr:uncharacterized protein LOC126654936 isoform X1 [Mercurialis annua]
MQWRTFQGFSSFTSESHFFYTFLLYDLSQFSISIMQSHNQQQQEMDDVLEVNRHLLGELEDMGFPLARAAKAIHHSGNTSIEAAINWIIDHENDPDIDHMPLIAVNIEIESPPASQDTEEMQNKLQELRDQNHKRKEEEEKKLEREREKERIGVGKEVLEAKRIAEDNERKRNLSLRKAEKEEQKRAREKVRHKLEADKAERRRMLGLPAPPVSHMPLNAQRHVVQEKKNTSLSTTKAEQLRECLRSVRRNYKDDDASVKRAFRTLLTYVSNVAKNPYSEKFRKIRIQNPLFQERVGRIKGGIEFLELCGFERIEGGKFLFLPGDKIDMEVLNSAGSEIRSAITNPFFGLLSHG